MIRPVALYVDTERGPYPSLGVECFGVAEDARRYYGDAPVVAHPPCAEWGQTRGLGYKKSPEAGPIAVLQTIRCGGVLEHPRYSQLFQFMGLPTPRGAQLAVFAGGFLIEVDQVRWGHPCRKATWLLIAGCTPAALPPIPPPRQPTHRLSGPPRRDGDRLPVLWSSEAHLTPIAFAEWLVELAAKCRPLAPLDVKCSAPRAGAVRLPFDGCDE